MKALILLLGICISISNLSAAENATKGLVVASFNLRYASDRPPNSWPERRPVMKECFAQIGADIVGTQEGVYHQLKNIAEDQPQYDWIGLGRDGGSKGEFMAVFYKKIRFEPLEYDHFWLSDTPGVIASTTWGHSNRRMVTWVRFLDRATKKEFYFINTHFDHQVQPAREKAAQLIAERVKGLKTDLPIILLGDFNATAGANKAYDTLVNADLFTDTWSVAKEKRGEVVNTFHGFRGPEKGESRIDWVLFRGALEVEAVKIDTCARENQYPSDHFPVIAWLNWK